AVRASDIREELTAALDAWARISAGDERARLLRPDGLADDDPWRRELRLAYISRDREEVRRLAQRPEVAEPPPATVVRLAGALGATEQPALALEVLRPAAERHFADFWVVFEWAKACKQSRPPQLEEAVRAYLLARALRPTSAAVHNNLGNALHGLGRHAEAEAAYRDALRLQPDLPELHYNLGVALYDQQRHAAAESAFCQALPLRPEFAEALHSLGKAQAGQGKHAAAVAAVRAALRIKDDLPEAHRDLGLALTRQGKFADAEAVCREAVRRADD